MASRSLVPCQASFVSAPYQSISLLSDSWQSSPYINRFLSADTIVPDYANPQSLNRYSYVVNNPLRYTDPTGHMMSEGDGGGCGKKCKTYVEQRRKKKDGDDGGDPLLNLDSPNPAFLYSSDGAWNDPSFSTWNLLRQGSACTACHVTHWIGTIPTNSEIDLDTVRYYRSLDKIAHQVHWAAFAYVGAASQLARETVVIGHYNQNPNYVQVANQMGANYFQVDTALTAEQVTLQNEKFIVNGVQDGCRFVQCSFPVRPNSGLQSEIGWLEQSGYSSATDMSIEITTSFIRSALSLFGVATDK